MALRLGDNTQAERWNRQYMALSRELGHAAGSAWALHNLGMAAFAREDLERATEQLEESIALFRNIGDKRGQAANLNSLALIALSRGEYDRASALLEQSAALARETADALYLAAALEIRGSLELERGNHAEAEESWRQSLQLSYEIGDRRGVAHCLEGLAALAGVNGRAERAARLYGQAEALRAAIHSPQGPWDRARRARWVSLARSQMEDAGWTAARRQGKAMTVEEAVADALSDRGEGR